MSPCVWPPIPQGENVGELRVRITPHLTPAVPALAEGVEGDGADDDLDDDLLDIDSIDKLKGKEIFITVRRRGGGSTWDTAGTTTPEATY